VRALQAAETGINPVCAYRRFDHGRRTEWAVVLLHGFTNCPQMYEQLAKQLFDLGLNVLVPRLPHHGLADRLTTELTKLEAAEMEATAEQALEIATGLGDRVVVAGLSLGAVLAAWLAQFKSEVDRAVIIAPLFGAPKVPEWFSDLAGFIAGLIPNFWMWWDFKAKAAIEGPRHAYPRFPTHAYAEMLKLGHEIKREARRSAPRARDIRVVLNLNDPAVNNRATYRLIRAWRSHGANVRVYEFPRSQGLAHDLVSPDQTYARTAEVYPVLIDWIVKDVP
jgi:alpha-beta hydrolase superfamily lysophospholipase